LKGHGNVGRKGIMGGGLYTGHVSEKNKPKGFGQRHN